MDLQAYALKLEKEVFRLQDLLEEKEIYIQDKVCEAYNAGFREGIRNGELNILEKLN